MSQFNSQTLAPQGGENEDEENEDDDKNTAGRREYVQNSYFYCLSLLFN